jgi:alpha-amylase/alpha-mannosidase (GH57 family)
MTNRYVCIHGHFYQPPRENAWLEAVELQDSAYPYHDWNERITSECYEANAASRILDEQERIVQIVNNYSGMSFNFGPTLLAWLEEHAAGVYDKIIQADVQSRERFSGHGSALAQAYNHMILPLANQRDKHTQVLWGIRDFEHRFARKPKGMWLPETAVDLETLDVLVMHGIAFTILSPYQARRVRPFGEKEWTDVGHGTIDPRMPYRQHLSDGRSLAIFFYDGPISRAVAFERLLKSGEVFADRLVGGFDKERETPQLVHIATDGESYGHHHRHGDMALAYALDYLEANGLARLTNYGEYLEKYPPTHEVEIFENTSWSCAHGIERWRSDCGCQSGQNPEWNQSWREPLRNALNWLRDTLAPVYEEKISRYYEDPWQIRNKYIDLILNRSAENVAESLGRRAIRQPGPVEWIMVLKLLEMQRHLMLMYTSCGWFFDELSGIETVQVIQYAGRAIQLCYEMSGNDLEPQFMEHLSRAHSNIPQMGDGRRIFERFVKPSGLDLEKVAAHYAISSLFKDYPAEAAIFCYSASRQAYDNAEAGKAKLAVGRVTIASNITRETATFHFGVLHFGDHNLTCGVGVFPDEKNYQRLQQDMFTIFERGDFPEILKAQDDYFASSQYTLKTLFRDEQRNILALILENAREDALAVHRHLYENNVPLMRFLKDSGSPPPLVLRTAGELVINEDLRQEFNRDELDYDTIQNLIGAADLAGIPLEAETLAFALRKKLEQMAHDFQGRPENIETLEKMVAAVGLVYTLPFDVNLREVQNIHYDLVDRLYPAYWEKAARGDAFADRWTEYADALNEKLLIKGCKTEDRGKS